MKEASGEATMTVVTIAVIAVVLVAGTLIAKNVMQSTKRQSCCTAVGGKWEGGKCNGLTTKTTFNKCLQDKESDVKVDD